MAGAVPRTGIGALGIGLLFGDSTQGQGAEPKKGSEPRISELTVQALL